MSVKGTDGKTKKYYGSIAGHFGIGPWEYASSLDIDGKTIWPTGKAWADDVVGLTPITYERSANIARLFFADPINVPAGKQFVLTGMKDPTFNCLTPTIAQPRGDNHVVKYVNRGPNVSKRNTDQGSLTKVLRYGYGEIYRYGGVIWKCILTHTGTPDTAPPNETYWQRWRLLRSEATNPFMFTVADGNIIYGTAYLYWGTADQQLRSGSFLKKYGHPPYRRQVVLELVDFLFGTERQGPPNIRMTGGRLPQQSIIIGDSARLVDGQANPIATIAEMLTDPVTGIGRKPTMANVANWQQVADVLALTPGQTYFSPKLDSPQSFRAFVAAMTAYYGGWFRFGNDGRIEAGRFLHNEAPPEFDESNTINFHSLVEGEEIEFDTDGWSETKNEVVVKFTDRGRAWKDAGQSANSLWNRQIVGEPRRETLDRPWILREQQASDYAAEWIKVNAQRQLTGTMTLRAERVAAVRQGDPFKLVDDLLAFDVVCRCTEKNLSAAGIGKVTMRFESERGIAPLPHQPTVAAPGGTGLLGGPAGEPPAVNPGTLAGTPLPEPEKITLFQFVQPPPALSNEHDFELLVLAARSNSLTDGLRPWMNVSDATQYYQLGEQRNWCVTGVLAQDYASPEQRITAERGRAANVATLKVTAHGYSTGLRVSVFGLGGAGYNLDDVPITRIDADHFSYPSVGTNEATTADAAGTVTPGVDDDSESLVIAMDQSSVQADLTKISATQGADAINDNNLLVWIFNAADPTQFEIATLKAIRLDGRFYKLKVRRGRFATQLADWRQCDVVFIGYRRDLVYYTHAAFAEYARKEIPATFRLQSFTVTQEADLTDSDVCPDTQFVFHDLYEPQITWTSLESSTGGGAFAAIADFTDVFLPEDIFRFAFRTESRSGGLIETRLVARLGSFETVLATQSFSATAIQNSLVSFTLPTEGAWRIFAVARDQYGRVSEKELTEVGGLAAQQVLVQTADHQEGGGSQQCFAPNASKYSGGYSGSGIKFTANCATAGATIHYSIVAFGAAAGAYSAYTGELGTPLPKTVYFYATKASFADSPVIRFDYWYDAGGPSGA